MPDTEHEALAYTRYEVDCPACGDVIRLESDPAGENVECDICEATVHVRETR